MKRFLPVFLLFALTLSAQNGEKTCEILSKINTVLQREHYRHKTLDDSLSVYVFDSFMDRLDGNRNVFTKKEYESFLKHRLQLDNYFLQNNCSFLSEFTAVYKKALQRKKVILEKLQTMPLDYTTKDSIRFSKESFPFDLAEADLERVWKKRMRFDILEDISKMSRNLDSLKSKFAEIEKKSKAKIFDNNLCKLNAVLDNKKGLETGLQNDLFDIFCNYFDPHTSYLSLDSKSSFMSALSTSNLSLGLNLALNEKEEITVGEVVPGGPAAQSQKFEKGDIIVKVSNKNGEEYWVSCASLETIGDMLFSDTNKEIEITLRKKNGSLLDIGLRKELMKANENKVYSFIAEKDVRVGYINIPNFYSDFENNSIEGCADDVAKEIAKLERDKIHGLVIDLQDNGGGSMEEAIKLAGMFIDIGPVSVLSDSKSHQTIIKDLNRGSLYTGPLVILINGNSASASEFFSAAMQDYERAIIIGATSLGKATMQTIIPIDEKNQQDFVKVTMQKFYRITGESAQIKGVVPDVALPVLFDSLVHREKSYKTALAHDAIQTKARFQKYTLPIKDEIIQMSIKRVSGNDRFKQLNSLNNQINLRYNAPRSRLRLTLSDVYQQTHETDDLWDQVQKITEIPSLAVISNTSYEKEKMQFDTFEQEINAFKIKDVKTNPYLEEGIAIINDYIHLRNKPKP